MKRSQSVVGLVLLASIGCPKVAIAQVSADGTVGTIVSPGPLFNITGGIRPSNGPNLFHSFSQFSLPTGSSAIFQNDPTVTTIFSRVTGGSRSDINGTIQTQGNASLFLMNPNGILFGPNAKLELGGSFVGTTANSIKFSDGVEFSAGNVAANPLLTVNLPIGLQMGSNPGSITVNGSGHRLIRGGLTPVDLSNNPPGLRVNPGLTLGLIGGDIALVGGVLGAESGHVELGSVSQGTVGITTTSPRWRFDYGNIQQFGDIRLSQQSLADASGAPAGSIQLQGRNISLLEGSVVLLANFGGSGQGDLVVKADGLLELRSAGNHGFAHSLVASENFGNTTSSNIIISAQQLQLQEGANIIARNFGSGRDGNVTVNVADSINIQGFSAVDPSLLTAINAVTFGSGRAGDLSVSTGQLRIADGATTSNVSVGTGQGGDTTVHAKIGIEVVGENPIILSPSSMATTTFTRGNGGQLTVTTPQLIVRDGGAVTAITLGSGNAGDTVINVSERIEVIGKGVTSGIPSRISANAPVLPPVFQQAYNLPPRPTGNSGTLIVNTPSLLVRDGALVGVNHEGVGNAGNLHINAGAITLNNDGRISSDTFSGSGGDINVQANALILRYGSRINSTAGGTGDGGNITIDSPIIVGLENSDIIANAKGGGGGNITIKTQDLIGLKFRNTPTPRTDLTNDITANSEFSINGNVSINTIGIDPNNGLISLPVDLTDASRQIADRCDAAKTSSFIATGRGGMPQGPMKKKASDRPWHDLRPQTVSNSIVTPILSANSIQPIVEATAIEVDETGAIALVAPNPISAPTAATCGMAGSIGAH